MKVLGGCRGRVYGLVAAFAFLPSAAAMDGCAVCGSFEEKGGAALLAGLICPEPANVVTTARFTVEPNPVQSGQTVTLDASASSDPEGDIVRYEWDLDPAVIVSDGSPAGSQFEVDAKGEPMIRRQVRTLLFGNETRTIQLRVTDGRGATNVATRSLTIVGPPPPNRPPTTDRPPTAQFSVSPNPGFVGESVHFDGSASSDPEGGQLSFEWDFEGDGNFTSTGTDPTTLKIYNTPGTRDVRLRVTDPTGLTGESTVSVTINSGFASGLATTARLPAGGAPAWSSGRARRGSRFTARLRGAALRGREATLTRRGGRVVLRGLVARGRLRGRFRGRRRAGPSLRPFLSSRWTVRLAASVRPSRRTVRVRGVALVRFGGRGAGRGCLRIAMSSRRGRPLSGTFRLTGGSGVASRIRAVGRVVYRPETGRLRGRIGARHAAARPLPRACRQLMPRRRR